MAAAYTKIKKKIDNAWHEQGCRRRRRASWCLMRVRDAPAHVRAHARLAGNETVDALAKAAVDGGIDGGDAAAVVQAAQAAFRQHCQGPQSTTPAPPPSARTAATQPFSPAAAVFPRVGVG